jgi:hypothetical protein
MQRTLCAAAVLIVLGVGIAVAQSANSGLGTDPILGTWQLNVAKSKFAPGTELKSETRTYVLAGEDIKATGTSVDAAGKKATSSWIVNYDGKDRPMTGNPDSDALSLKRVDTFTTQFVQKKAGKVVMTGTRSITKDGKTMTITTKGTSADGKKIDEALVFDKR